MKGGSALIEGIASFLDTEEGADDVIHAFRLTRVYHEITPEERQQLERYLRELHTESLTE